MIEQLNSLAQVWWEWMGPMFWQVGVLVLVFGTVDLLLRRQLWPQLRYALWLLILIKLMVPPSFSLSTGIVCQLRGPLEQRRSQLEMTSTPMDPPKQESSLLVSTPTRDMDTLSAPAVAPQFTPEQVVLGDLVTARDPIRPSWQAYLMIVWLMGVGVLGTWLIIKLRRLRRVYRDRSCCSDLPPWFGLLLAETAHKLHLDRLPAIVLSRDIPSPAVFGALRPVLVLPEAALSRLSRRSTEHILLHELAHIKRGDLWVNAWYTLLQVLYWFNPLLWLLRRRLQHLRELCCDATVANILRERTGEYRETILESAQRLLIKPVTPGIGLLGLFESSSRLRARLKWLEKKTWTYRGLRIVVVLALVGAMCLFMLPMAKTRANPPVPMFEGQWPCFRGPSGAGICVDRDIPRSWDGASGKGILWKSPIPLAGNSSPIVWQDRVFLSGGQDNRLEVYCFDGTTGKRLWTGTVPMTRPPANQDFEVLEDTGLAAPTMVTDGQRVCAIFATGDMACFDFQGQRLWTRGLGLPDSAYGYASSLAIHMSLAIVQYDQAGPEDGKSALLALDMASGNIVWRTPRPVANSWTSPIVTQIEGKDTILTCADPWVIAYDPATGAELWRIEGVTGDLAASPIYANGQVLAVEPYSHLVAIDPKGSGELSSRHRLWVNEDSGPDICSPVSDGEMVYLLDTMGLLNCCRASDGTPLWEEDLRQTFFASPCLVDGSLYLLGYKGTMSIVQAGAEYKLLGESALGERCSASPAFVNGRIYIRGEKHLFCIGSTDEKLQELTAKEERASSVNDSAIAAKTALNGGQLTRFGGMPADLRGAWPGFRGRDRDNISRDGPTLAQQWPVPGPKVLWSVDVGEGYAGAAVRNGRVYLMDHDREHQVDAIRCFSLADGQEIWRHTYPIKVKRWHGMTRTVPAVTDDYVVTMGPKGHVTCVHAITGEFKWTLDLAQEYGAKIPQWYTAQCPLIDQGKVIIAPGADKVLMMAVDCASGEVLWTTPNPDNWVMTHSSIVPMTFAGERFYIYCGGSGRNGGVVGVCARDGRVLWKNERWRVRTNVPAPVVVEPDRIFVSAGYGQTQHGCGMLRLVSEGGKIQATLEFLHPSAVFGSMMQTPILFQDHLYGVGMNKKLVCLDLKGRTVWTSSQRFGLGPYLLAHDKLYILDDEGILTMVEATATGYRPLARAALFENGTEAWGPMAMAAGRLIMRDLTRMICVDLSQSSKNHNLSSTSPEKPNDKALIENTIMQMWRGFEASDLSLARKLGPGELLSWNDNEVSQWVKQQIALRERVLNKYRRDLAKVDKVWIRQDEAVAISTMPMQHGDGEAYLYYFVKLVDDWALYVAENRIRWPRILTPDYADRLFNNWVRTPLDNEAWQAYLQSAKLLYEGKDRATLARQFTVIGQEYEMTRQGRTSAELGHLLTQMVLEDQTFVEPKDIQGLPLHQQIDYYVFKLRDVTAQEMFIPGKCRVLDHARTSDNPAQALREMGKAAVPALIQLLQDRRPTRSVSDPRNGGVVLRNCDVALEIIEDIAQEKFDTRTERGTYLSSADADTHKEIVFKVKNWWGLTGTRLWDRPEVQDTR